MTTHELKITTAYFHFVCAGVKKAEFRLNDRQFKEGDLLKLCEWLPEAEGYTGDYVFVRVTNITDVSQWAPGYVMLSFDFGPWKS
ncbi:MULTISPECIES: DUF3850 domain-containing protein [Serratia]|uniref:Domain of Uncharacterized Function with PDB structure n=1 Tax=Serratia quinivorans TaxID=137545 RepID=A0A380A9N5_9GAMM|nr:MULTISPECIES: DUF3850 domain-containing protein [Serratia]RYM62622.1 hypothetical protein BSR03_09460 [Serratia proteamaculans]CAI1864009.1 Domain of Uncharacterised Function with PDB structure [Serratia quinivorans]SUI76868.1 Domain of Uncharacterised Function with PDB structure [Serratia quinivorans]